VTYVVSYGLILGQNLNMKRNLFAALLVAFISITGNSSLAQAPQAEAHGINPAILPADPKERGRFIQNLRDVPALQNAIDVKERHVVELMGNPGIHTAGISWGEDGRPVIKLFAEESSSGKDRWHSGGGRIFRTSLRTERHLRKPWPHRLR
jgi:hypothetical protein